MKEEYYKNKDSYKSHYYNSKNKNKEYGLSPKNEQEEMVTFSGLYWYSMGILSKKQNQMLITNTVILSNLSI